MPYNIKHVEGDVFLRITVLQQLLESHLKETLGALCPADLTFNRMMTVVRLGKFGPLSYRDFKIHCYRGPHPQQFLEQLVRAGYAFRRQNPQKRSISILEATDRGKALSRKVLPVLELLEVALAKTLLPEAITQVENYLYDYVSTLGRPTSAAAKGQLIKQ